MPPHNDERIRSRAALAPAQCDALDTMARRPSSYCTYNCSLVSTLLPLNQSSDLHQQPRFAHQRGTREQRRRLSGTARMEGSPVPVQGCQKRKRQAPEKGHSTALGDWTGTRKLAQMKRAIPG